MREFMIRLKFQHAAARRRLDKLIKHCNKNWLFQHAAARRRLGIQSLVYQLVGSVSTRSRPKAAGCFSY